MIQLGQFTFYRSYYESIQGIKNPKVRCQIYENMFNYVLNGIEPELENAPSAVTTVFLINRPHFDTSRKKAMNAMSKGKKTELPSPGNSQNYLQDHEAMRQEKLSQLRSYF